MRIKTKDITVAFIAAAIELLNPTVKVTGVQCAAVYTLLECEADEFDDTELLAAVADALETIERHSEV